MASVTFVINDQSTGGAAPTVQVTITENPDGTLTFQVTQLASGGYLGDLRGIFFDVRDEALIGSLAVISSSGGPLTEVRTGDDSVEDLGNGANMNGLLGTVDPAQNTAGAEGNGYDVGLELGAAGIGADDVRSFTFTLDSTARDLTLADFVGADFGVRVTSVGQVDAAGNFIGPRDDSSKIVENIDAPTGNTAPISTNDAVATNEDTTVTLGLGDFGDYADAENTPLAAVRITALPVEGSLQYDTSGAGAWVAVTLNQVISAAEIGAGRLRFAPDADENGAGYATIGFQVSDGVDFSAASYTLTVDVSAVNDAAVITGTVSGTVDENAVPNTATGDLNAADVDNAPDAFQAVAPGAASVNGYGSYAVTAAGVWTYTLDNNNAAVNALNEGGAPLTDTFTVYSEDGAAQVVTITITGSLDVITGTPGPDLLTGFGGDDSIIGLGSNDTIIGGAGNDTINGGGGFDRSQYNLAPAAIAVQLAAGVVTGGDGTDTLRSVEAVRGTSSADTFNAVGFSGVSANAGSFGAQNEFEGLAGNDTITGNGDTRVSYTQSAAAVSVNLAAGVASDGFGGTDIITGANRIRGSASADTLTGGLAANNNFEQYEGRGGDDTITGGSGFDRADYNNDGAVTSGLTVNLAAGTVVGDAALTGTDLLLSVEAIRGSILADVFDATGFSGASANAGSQGTANEFEGMAGNDTITGNGGTRVTYQQSPAGVQVNLSSVAQGALAAGTAIDGWGAIDTFLGGIASVNGSEFADQIWGGTANEVLFGFGGNDTIIAGDGDDLLLGGAGSDSIDGGAGADQLFFRDSVDAVTVNLSVAGPQLVSASQGVDTFADIEQVTGSAFGDVLTGNGTGNIIRGGGGGDTIDGGAGDDGLLFGGHGHDSVIGGVGNDGLRGEAGDDTLDGGDDFDFAHYADATESVSVDLSIVGPQFVSASQGADTLVNIEGVNGSNVGDDVLRGNDQMNILGGAGGSDSLYGGDARDVLHGEGGDDLALGEGGDDIITGSAGNDTLDGGSGADEADYFLSSDGITIDLALAGAQMVSASQGSDQLVSIEAVQGSNVGNDLLLGDGQANFLFGHGGDDTLLGGGGGDNLQGGEGDDRLGGGVGNDTLTGDGGADQFVFDAATDAVDMITDFTSGAGGDAVVLQALGLISSQVVLQDIGGSTLLSVDLDGIGVGADPIALATLSGVVITDVNTMIANGNLII